MTDIQMNKTLSQKEVDRKFFNAIMQAQWKEAMECLEQIPLPDINQLIEIKLSARSSSGEYLNLALEGVQTGVDSLFTMALRRHMFPVCDKMIEIGVDLMLPDGRGSVLHQIIQNDSVVARYINARFLPQVVSRKEKIPHPLNSLELCIG